MQRTGVPWRLTILYLLVSAAMAIFSGSVEMSSSTIGDEDVTYTFRLSFQ